MPDGLQTIRLGVFRYDQTQLTLLDNNQKRQLNPRYSSGQQACVMKFVNSFILIRPISTVQFKSLPIRIPNFPIPIDRAGR